MGRLNVTPDSVSDGGMYFDPEAAVEHAFDMIDEGADIIDIGAESTRPGCSPVSVEEEMRRLIPALRAVADSSDIIISVDTMNPETARAAVDAGADIINDVNALRRPGMLEFAAESAVPIIISHMYGDPGNTHSQCMDGPVIPAIRDFLKERTEAALQCGVDERNIITDPGIGFGKTNEQNEEIIRRISDTGIGYPILAGMSRKRVISYMYPDEDRDIASAKAAAIATDAGADIIRVHNVHLTTETLRSACRRV